MEIYTDGGSRGNPGPAATGMVIVSPDDGTVLREAGVYLGRATNNVAEYSAVLAALEAARDLGADCVDLYSDSELLVRQMNGQYRVRNPKLRVLYAQARALVERFNRCTINHIRRADNGAADALVNQALNMERNVADAAD
ncbi:MAG: ribonuclease HI family protein [Planctomycetes bacterium]|nr:ribonuclease HI family protein [Planctomycetota bacterium]